MLTIVVSIRGINSRVGVGRIFIPKSVTESWINRRPVLACCPELIGAGIDGGATEPGDPLRGCLWLTVEAPRLFASRSLRPRVKPFVARFNPLSADVN